MSVVEKAPEYVGVAELRVQRRLLLTFTFLLAAIHGLDVNIGRQISMQGLVLDIEHTKLLIGAIWAAWIWSCWRYWQHERLYSSSDYFKARRTAFTIAARKAVFSELERQVAAGLYSERGLPPGQDYSVSPVEGAWISSADRPDATWSSPKVEIWIAATAPDTKNRKLEGGGNCTFSREEAATLKRDVERELRLRYPHFADVKLPYALALIAPLAGLVQLGRHYWPAISDLLGL